MNTKRILFIILIIATITGCKNNPANDSALTITPDAGTRYQLGQPVAVKVSIPGGTKADSVVYLVDSVKVASYKDTLTVKIPTDSMMLGSRLITARIFVAGKPQEVSTNITLLAANAPEQYTFVVEKVYPHDTTSYTEGLVYQDGYLYESGGGYLDPPPGQGKDVQSRLSKMDLTTGKVLQKALVDPKVFAEGISIIGDKIVQLSYKEKIGYVYDKASFKLLSTFNNNVGAEGWGMCFDGKKLYMDDSTNRLWFLDKDNYRQIGYVDVYDDKQAIQQINELEYIDGKIYANIWQTDTIIVINPKNGAVLETIDLANLYPKSKRNANSDVLNGIAWDTQGKRLFITGKKWDKLFQVKFVKK